MKLTSPLMANLSLLLFIFPQFIVNHYSNASEEIAIIIIITQKQHKPASSQVLTSGNHQFSRPCLESKNIFSLSIPRKQSHYFFFISVYLYQTSSWKTYPLIGFSFSGTVPISARFCRVHQLPRILQNQTFSMQFNLSVVTTASIINIINTT
jgi:hypothetical protein